MGHDATEGNSAPPRAQHPALHTTLYVFFVFIFQSPVFDFTPWRNCAAPPTAVAETLAPPPRGGDKTKSTNKTTRGVHVHEMKPSTVEPKGQEERLSDHPMVRTPVKILSRNRFFFLVYFRPPAATIFPRRPVVLVCWPRTRTPQ